MPYKERFVELKVLLVDDEFLLQTAGGRATRALVDVLPELLAAHPERYRGMGLRDLADEIFEQMKRSDQLALQATAFSHLPQPELTPNQTYQRLVHDEVEQVPLEAMANRVVTSGVVPYPPGIPC